MTEAAKVWTPMLGLHDKPMLFAGELPFVRCGDTVRILNADGTIFLEYELQPQSNAMTEVIIQRPVQKP